MFDGSAQTAARGRVAARIRALGAHLSEAAFEIEHGRIGALAHEIQDGASVPAEHAYGVVARAWLAECAQVAVALGELDGMAQGRRDLGREQDLAARRDRAVLRELPPLPERLDLVPGGPDGR